MLSRPLGRFALVTVALLCSLHGPAQATGLFKKKCDDDDTRSTREVSVRTYDTVRLSRRAPAIGTVYVPIAAMPIARGDVGRGVDDTDDETLSRAMSAARDQLRHEISRAALRAEIEAKQRFLERMGAGSAGAAAPEVAAKLDELTKKIDQLAERVGALEKLTLIHDNYIRKQLEPELPKPTPVAPK